MILETVGVVVSVFMLLHHETVIKLPAEPLLFQSPMIPHNIFVSSEIRMSWHYKSIQADKKDCLPAEKHQATSWGNFIIKT